MPTPALTLWIDPVSSSLAYDWQSSVTAQQLSLRQGDHLGIEIHQIKRNSTTGSIMTEVPWSPTANITMAIGLLDAKPTGGTFRLAYGATSTATLPFDATPTQLQNALNAIPAIASEGGVSVDSVATTYRIYWNNAVVPASTLTVSYNDLLPTSTASLGEARQGSTISKQVYQLHIKQAPVAVNTQWVDQETSTLTVVQTHSPSYSKDFRIWRLSINPRPKDGSFRIGGVMNGVTKWTYPLTVRGLSPSVISNALSLDVVQVSDYEYEISQSQDFSTPTKNVTNLQVDGSGIISFSSKYGVISLNTLETELLLAGQASVTAYLEVEVEQAGARNTILQTTVTITNDLIDTDAYELVEWGQVLPVDSVVRFDTAQALTTPQKTQARTNIGALATADLTAINATTTDLDARISVLEGNGLTSDQQDAVAGSATPSATNVLVTTSALTTTLAGKASTNHTHTISDVTNLQTELTTLTNGKANTTHTHSTLAITGLDASLTSLTNSLASKAGVGHTHGIVSIDGLATALSQKADNTHTHSQNAIDSLGTDLNQIRQRISTTESAITNFNGAYASFNHTHQDLPTYSQKEALSNASAPSGTNPFLTQYDLYGMQLPFLTQSNASGYSNGSFDTVHYPLEIRINLNGTTYAIPARQL